MLSEKLLPLNITCLEGRSCCTTHTPDTGPPEYLRILSLFLTIFWQIYWSYLFQSRGALIMPTTKNLSSPTFLTLLRWSQEQKQQTNKWTENWFLELTAKKCEFNFKKSLTPWCAGVQVLSLTRSKFYARVIQILPKMAKNTCR